MSAGHHTAHRHSEQLARELERVLSDKRVIEYLKRPHRVDFSHQMPLTGGSSVDGRVYFLDPRLKRKYTVGTKAGQDLSGPVLRHEMVEKALRAVFGLSYARAHALATCAERFAVEAMGLSWAAYKNVMESIVRRDEHERPKTLPREYDLGPLRASGGLKSLRGLTRKAA